MRRYGVVVAALLVLFLAAWEYPPPPAGSGGAGPGGTLPEGTITGDLLTWDDVAAEWVVAANFSYKGTHIVIDNGYLSVGGTAPASVAENTAVFAGTGAMWEGLDDDFEGYLNVDSPTQDWTWNVYGDGSWELTTGTIYSGVGIDSGDYIAADGSITSGAFYVATPGTLTIADSGDGNPATSTSVPTDSVMAVTCSDAHSCEWTIGETAIVSGAKLTVTNVGTNRLVLIHSSGVVELNGASRQTLMGGASATLWYDADRWTQTGAVVEVTDGIKTLTSGDSPYALLYTDKVLICDTTGGNIEIDITPAAAFDQTRVVSFLKTVAGNSLILDPNASENLNGTSTSTTITTALDGMSIKSDGTDLWGF